MLFCSPFTVCWLTICSNAGGLVANCYVVKVNLLGVAYLCDAGGLQARTQGKNWRRCEPDGINAEDN